MQTKVVLRKNDFERLLSESLDDALTDLFGEKSKQIIYAWLKRKYRIAREEIPERLSDFDLALTEMFRRSSGAIRKVIVKRLYSRMRIEFVERANYGLLDYVADARLSAQPFILQFEALSQGRGLQNPLPISHRAVRRLLYLDSID